MPQIMIEAIYSKESTKKLDLISLHRYLADNNNFLREVKRFGRRKRIETLSLDLFDTIVLRDSRPELERFYQVSKAQALRLDIDISAISVFLARSLAHSYAYKNTYIASKKVKTEPTDIDIISTMLSMLGQPKATSETIKALIECELDWEISDSEPSPLIPRIIEALNPSKIIILSDMYLSADAMKNLLNNFVPQISPDIKAIFSSAYMQKSKRKGDMFKEAFSCLGIEPKKALHIGDNIFSDYIQAKKNNINSICIPIPHEELQARNASFNTIVNKFPLLKSTTFTA